MQCKKQYFQAFQNIIVPIPILIPWDSLSIHLKYQQRFQLPITLARTYLKQHPVNHLLSLSSNSSQFLYREIIFKFFSKCNHILS